MQPTNDLLVDNGLYAMRTYKHRKDYCLYR